MGVDEADLRGTSTPLGALGNPLAGFLHAQVVNAHAKVVNDGRHHLAATTVERGQCDANHQPDILAPAARLHVADLGGQLVVKVNVGHLPQAKQAQHSRRGIAAAAHAALAAGRLAPRLQARTHQGDVAAQQVPGAGQAAQVQSAHKAATQTRQVLPVIGKEGTSVAADAALASAARKEHESPDHDEEQCKR